jgi:hypothetical protein
VRRTRAALGGLKKIVFAARRWWQSDLTKLLLLLLDAELKKVQPTLSGAIYDLASLKINWRAGKTG